MRTEDALRYLAHARDCAQRAEEAEDPLLRKGWLDMQAHWLALAEAADKYPVHDECSS